MSVQLVSACGRSWVAVIHSADLDYLMGVLLNCFPACTCGEPYRPVWAEAA